MRETDFSTWLAMCHCELPVAEATEWASVPWCGGVVAFQGTVRDHSADRPDVLTLEYEAYERYCRACLEAIVGDARERWPELGRIALLHRLGSLQVGETAVLVAVSAPHRGAAFDGARYCIDSIKERLPVWKRETWSGGSSWVTCAHNGGIVLSAPGHP